MVFHCQGQWCSLVIGRGGGRRGGLCSVSIDRLDYDCLASGVDICVSSLTSAALLCSLRCLSLYEPQSSEWGPTL